MSEDEELEAPSEATAAAPEGTDRPDEVTTLVTNDPDSAVWITLPAAGNLWVACMAQPGQAALVHEGEYTWLNPGAATYPVEQGDSLTYSIQGSEPFSLSWGYASG